MMEPLISKSEDYNYTFFRRMIENIKQTKDAQDPDDDETNMVSVRSYFIGHMQLFHCIGGAMFTSSVVAFSAVDHEFEPQSGQTKDQQRLVGSESG